MTEHSGTLNNMWYHLARNHVSSALPLPLTILSAINTKFDSNLTMIQTIEILEPPAKCKKNVYQIFRKSDEHSVNHFFN